MARCGYERRKHRRFLPGLGVPLETGSQPHGLRDPVGARPRRHRRSRPGQGPGGRQHGGSGPVPRGIPAAASAGISPPSRRSRTDTAPCSSWTPRSPRAPSPIDAPGMGADAVAAGAYKWLCGPFGIAVMYLGAPSRHEPRARPGGLSKPGGHLGYPHRSAGLPGGRVPVRVQHDGLRVGRRVREIDRIPRGHRHRPDLRP